MAEKDVRVIQVVGEAPTHVFRHPEGFEIDVPCSRKEYDGLRGRGAQPPRPPVAGAVWLYSAVRAVFDVGEPAKDDCIVGPDGNAVLFTGGDAYRGGVVTLAKEEFNPRIVNGKLVTDKPLPAAASTVGVDAAAAGKARRPT